MHLDSCYVNANLLETFEAGVIDIMETFQVVDIYSNVEVPQIFNF